MKLITLLIFLALKVNLIDYLILKHLLNNIEIDNLSDSDDTNVLEKSLLNDSEIVDVGHAGTAMRFLTAYYSIQENKVIKFLDHKECTTDLLKS